MRLRVVAAIAAGGWLIASSASAQAVRSAGGSRPTVFTPPPAQPPPPPAQPPLTPIIPPTPPPPRDLFRAGPDTYAPRFDRPNQSLFFPYVVAGYPTAYGAYGDVYDRHGTTIIVTPAPMAAAQPSTPAPAPPPVVPGIPKTLYVIPGCYGGDTPPRADRLPPGCTVKGMRRIEPPKAGVQ